MLMKIFLKVGSSKKTPEDEYDYEYDSDESEYDLKDYWKKLEKEHAEYEKKLESWKEGGKEGECVFTPDCKKVL